MSTSEEEGVYYWKQYSLHLQTGALLSLTIVLMALQVNWSTTPNFETTLTPPEIIKATDVQPTKHSEPPPPPKPPSPVEVPNDEIVEGEAPDYDITIDPDDGGSFDAPPPPTDEPPKEDEPFITVEQPPALVGGMKALYESVEYPSFAKKAGIEGRVIVQFVVDKNGNVQDLTVMRGAHKLLNEEALRVIKQQTFEPGKQRGRAVPVKMTIPITFRLQ